MNVIDLSTLRKPDEAAAPEPGEEVVVQTFKLPRLTQPAPRVVLAGVELSDGRVANLSMHAEGLCLFFEAPGEQTRVMPREALLQGWLPAFTTSVTEVMPPIDDAAFDAEFDAAVTELVQAGRDLADAVSDDEALDPVAHRIEADRTAHAADEAPIPLEPTP